MTDISVRWWDERCTIQFSDVEKTPGLIALNAQCTCMCTLRCRSAALFRKIHSHPWQLIFVEAEFVCTSAEVVGVVGDNTKGSDPVDNPMRWLETESDGGNVSSVKAPWKRIITAPH